MKHLKLNCLPRPWLDRLAGEVTTSRLAYVPRTVEKFRRSRGRGVCQQWGRSLPKAHRSAPPQGAESPITSANWRAASTRVRRKPDGTRPTYEPTARAKPTRRRPKPRATTPTHAGDKASGPAPGGGPGRALKRSAFQNKHRRNPAHRCPRRPMAWPSLTEQAHHLLVVRPVPIGSGDHWSLPAKQTQLLGRMFHVKHPCNQSGSLVLGRGHLAPAHARRRHPGRARRQWRGRAPFRTDTHKRSCDLH